MLRLRPPGELHPRPIQLLDQAGVLDRGRGLIGEALEEAGLVVVVGVGPVAADRDRAERAGFAAERCREDGSEAGLADEGIGDRRMGESIVAEVLPRPECLPRRDRPAGDPLPDRERRIEAGLAGPDRIFPGGEGPRQGRPVGIEHVDPGRIGVGQATGFVHGLLEDRLDVAERGDVGGDLADGPLGLGSPAELDPRTGERVDQLGVRHGQSGVIGQRADQRDIVLAVRISPTRVDPHRPERAVGGNERRDEERGDRQGLDQEVRAREMDETRIAPVVAGQDRLALGDGPSEHADARLDLQRPDPLPAVIVRDPGIVGEPEPPGCRVEQVCHRAVGAQQAGRLLEGVVEDAAVRIVGGFGSCAAVDDATVGLGIARNAQIG